MPAPGSESSPPLSAPRLSTAPVSFDVAAVASVAGFRDSCGNVPLDACVPMRTDVVAPASLPLRCSFVLLHVDGSSSLQKIAELACLSLPETIEAFLQLIMTGTVVLKEEEPPQSAHRDSGIQTAAPRHSICVA